MVNADERPAPDPLEVARLRVASAERIAERYAAMEQAEPGIGSIRAHVDGAGRQQFDLEQRAGYMALVSIAGDLRRIADAVLDDPGEPPERLALEAIIQLIDGPGSATERMSGARALAAETLRTDGANLRGEDSHGKPGPEHH